MFLYRCGILLVVPMLPLVDVARKQFSGYHIQEEQKRSLVWCLRLKSMYISTCKEGVGQGTFTYWFVLTETIKPK